MDGGGHAYLAIELLDGADASLGSLVGVREVVRHSHHVDGKLHESAQVLVLDISCPCGPYCRQSCAMGDAKECAELMLEAVSGEVFLGAALGEVVVCQRARPHDLRAMAIVLGVAQHH